jgi:hypothetical protein
MRKKKKKRGKIKRDDFIFLRDVFIYLFILFYLIFSQLF